jgi:hypothetical protein
MLGGMSLAAGPAYATDHPSWAAGVRSDGGRLSVHVDQLPLRDLIATLERTGLARIVVRGNLSGMTVSDSFDDSDVAHALRRMLSAHSHLLIDRGASDDVRVIELILLTPRDSEQPANGGEPVGLTNELLGEDVSVEALMDAARSSSSPAERAAAAEQLAYRPGSGPGRARHADQVLVEQLSDPDEQVRARALETLKDTSDAVPEDAVAQVARNDISAERRIQALELLAERVAERARGPLKVALADSAPAVRARARELIDDWDLAR